MGNATLKKENLEKVRDFYKQNPGLTTANCRKATGLSAKTVYNNIKIITAEMIEAGNTIADCCLMFKNLKSQMVRDSANCEKVRVYFSKDNKKTIAACGHNIGLSFRAVRKSIATLKDQAIISGLSAEVIDKIYPVSPKQKQDTDSTTKEYKNIFRDSGLRSGTFSESNIWGDMGWGVGCELSDTRGFCRS